MSKPHQNAGGPNRSLGPANDWMQERSRRARAAGWRNIHMAQVGDIEQSVLERQRRIGPAQLGRPSFSMQDVIFTKAKRTAGGYWDVMAQPMALMNFTVTFFPASTWSSTSRSSFLFEVSFVWLWSV